MSLCVDVLHLIYSFGEKEYPFLSLLSTNKEYHILKSKFRYNKTFYLCHNKDWNETTIPYFRCIQWIVCAKNKKEVPEVPIYIDALQIHYNRPLKRNFIPKHITRLYFYNDYDKLIFPGNLPNTITYLSLPKKSKQTLDYRFIPESVETLVLGGCGIDFYPKQFPSLTTLIINCFNESLRLNLMYGFDLIKTIYIKDKNAYDHITKTWYFPKISSRVIYEPTIDQMEPS